MKKLYVAILMMLMPSIADAKDSVLSCFTPNYKEHLVIVGRNGDVMLSWDGGPFHYGTAEIKDNYLIVVQYGKGGTFRFVYDTDKGTAFGGTVFYDNHESKTSFNCVWQ